MQAILVTYIPPSQLHGAKWRARCTAGFSVAVQDTDLNDHENVCAAIDALLNKLCWSYEYTIGQLPNGDYCAILGESI